MEKWQVYLREAETQIDFAKRSYAAFRSAEASGVVEDVFFCLHHFVIHATNIDKILDTKPETERHGILSGHIDLSGINLKPFRRLCNHLEHFDERLDRWVREYDGHAFFDMNIVTGARGLPKKAFLRALDGDAFKFHGEDYNMTELYDSILEIERRLTTVS
ncbi:MAG TPA: hypothetical protein VMT12_14905 [Syntrophales bacterium]|nr:hypothetical protein [Syntrophales bacterium]